MPRSNSRKGEYLLQEANLRTMLTNMYNALRTTANSRIIVEKTPDKIGRGEYSGDELARNSMAGLCGWLSGISSLAKDDATYRAAFLDPVRAAAKMRLKLSRMTTRSASFDALVFAQMQRYDREYKTQRTIMSAVVPGLQAPMSVRVSAENKDLRGHGYRVLEKCQPVPLANRIHQTGGQVRRSGRRIRLSEFDFLYTALEDVRSLGRSLEMENFCEVPSPDAKPRPRLAAPFVTFGTVEASGPAVWVKSLDGKHRVKMIAQDQAAELSGAPPAGFERKTARLLGAQWYEPDGDPDSVPEDPSLYCIEADGDLGALRLQEACGRVRLRGSVPAGEIPEGLRGRLSELPCISAEKGSVAYARRRARGEVGTHFLEAHGGICKTRTKLNAVQLTEDQVIDRRKSGVSGLAGALTSRKHGALGALLLDFVMQMDERQEYDEGAAAKSLCMEPGAYGGKMASLRSFGIAEKADGGWNLTKKGRDVAKEISKRMAGRIPDGDLPAVLNPDALAGRGIPPSMTLFLLRSGALAGYRPALLGGRTTEVYWVGRGEPEGLAGTLERLERSVLEAMGGVSHSSTAAGIAPDVRVSAFTTELLLSEMSKDPDGPVRPDGGSWEYTVAARVRDLLERERRQVLSEDDVAVRIGVGTARREEVGRALESLVRAGVAARIEGGAFSHSSDLESKRGARMEKTAENAVMEALSSQDGMEDDRMIDLIVKLLVGAGMEGDAAMIERARKVLNGMEEDGRICRNGSRLLKPAP